MLVRKIGDTYEFESLTTDSAFLVKFILTDSGEEKLTTLPIGVDVVFTPKNLKPGSIKETIGDIRWQNFLRMKDKGIDTMFIDPQKEGIGTNVV